MNELTEDQQIRIAALPVALTYAQTLAGISLHDYDAETESYKPSQKKFDRYISPWLDIISKSIEDSNNNKR